MGYDIVEILIPVLAFLAVVLIGSAFMTSRTAARKRIQARLEYDALAPQDDPSPVRNRLAKMAERVGSIASSGSHSQVLRQDLARAGIHDAAAPMIYIGAKMILLLGGMLLLLVLVMFMPPAVSLPARVVIVLGGAAIMFFLPNILIVVRRQQRRMEIRHHLPAAVDLLEICVSSGMGLDMGWNMVTDEVRRVSSTLADEMALTNLEMHLGASRVEAMRHMADRTGAEELGSLVAVLVQSERFGTSISEALKTFASSMREERSTLAQENSEKTAVKLLFPMTLLIFPAMLIVIIGPATLRFSELAGK